MGINVDPGYPDNYNVKIKGGTYTGSIIGLFVSDVGIPNTKISGGHFKSTSTAVSDNVGGIAIWKSDATNGTSIYTLNSLLASGYNYTSKTFTDVPITFATDPVTYSTTASDVYVKKESTITIKNGITNGTITSTKATALTDEEVTLTVTPSAGYKLKSISVLDRYDEMPVTVINNKFTMPNYNVFVSAEFEKDVNYVVTEGANGSIINTSGDSLTFRINAEYSLLNKVYVDNEEISSDKMVTKSGSTIITLKNDYLKTLAVGKHTLKVSFTDGKEAITNFEIKAENKTEKDDTPKTGEEGKNYWGLYFTSIGLTIVMLLTSIRIIKNAEREEKNQQKM